MVDRPALTRRAYEAFARGDREAMERLLHADLTFSAPPDPHLAREGFFTRCWPGAGSIGAFDIVRLVEHGEEVIVTYEATRPDGTRFRNTEVLTFAGAQIVRQEVYFGWDLDASGPA